MTRMEDRLSSKQIDSLLHKLTGCGYLQDIPKAPNDRAELLRTILNRKLRRAVRKIDDYRPRNVDYITEEEISEAVDSIVRKTNPYCVQYVPQPTIGNPPKSEGVKTLYNEVVNQEAAIAELTPKEQKSAGFDLRRVVMPTMERTEFIDKLKKIKETLHSRDRLPYADFSGLETASEDDLLTLQKVLHNFFKDEFKVKAEEDRKLWFACELRNSSKQNAWSRFPLTVANYNALLKNLKNGSFFLKTTAMDSWSSDQASVALPSWNLIKRFEIVPQNMESQVGERFRPQGGFFPYKVKQEMKSKKILEALYQCQIFQSVKDNEEAFTDSCWIYAHKQNEDIPKQVVAQMTQRFKNVSDPYIRQDEAIQLSHEYGIQVLIRNYDGKDNIPKMLPKSDKRLPEKDAKYSITINKYKQHYFISKPISLTNSFLERVLVKKEDISDQYADKYYIPSENVWRVDNKRARDHPMKTEDLVMMMEKNGWFEPMSYHDYTFIPSVQRPSIDEISDLQYDPNYCIRSFADLEAEKRKRQLIIEHTKKTYNEDEEDDKREWSRWFGDTESDVTGEIHRAYMFCLQSEDGKTKQTFKGEHCIEDGLKFLPDHSIVFFHNLGYDVRFFAKFGAVGEGIIHGNKVYSLNIKYEGKKLKFRDTYAMIPSALAKFPKMFKLDEQQKEVFPYEYYTMERLNEGGMHSIIEAAEYLKNEEDQIEFNDNVLKIGCADEDGMNFAMYPYAEFYCKQDVNLLNEGYMKFHKMVQEAFNIDTFKVLTAPALANQVFVNLVYSKNPKLKMLGGLPSDFIRQSIHGGRVMTARNKSWHTKARIVDFDACSLYPSAMARLEIPLGDPKVIPPEGLNLEWLKAKNCYVIRVVINPLEKHRDFPLPVFKGENGNNVNSDTFTDPVTIVYNNIEFEDLLEFYPNVSYTILCGYYWDEGVDTEIQKVISDIFDQRRKYKDEGNPLQEVFKLIMNSAYGKTIQKFIEKEVKFVPECDVEKFCRKNYNFIDEDTCIEGSTIHKITVRRAINNQFAPVIIGSLILAMSKRIMNEVMCLAEDIGCKIFYQDTDSMHILEEDLERLATEYEKKYHRVLCGKQLGQFHSDFDEAATEWGLDPKTTVAIESYFLAKKVYIDKLQDKEGKIGYHIRMKGISQEAVKERSTTHNGLMGLYRDLYGGEGISFNLLAGGKPSFEYDDDYTITSRSSFDRRIQIRGEKDEFKEAPNVDYLMDPKAITNNHLYKIFAQKLGSNYNEDEIFTLYQDAIRANQSWRSERGKTRFQDTNRDWLKQRLKPYRIYVYDEVPYGPKRERGKRDTMDLVCTKLNLKKEEIEDHLDQCVFISSKFTYQYNRWKDDKYLANKALAYMLICSGRIGFECDSDHSKNPSYPKPDKWNDVVKNPNAKCVVHVKQPTQEDYLIMDTEMIDQIVEWLS